MNKPNSIYVFTSMWFIFLFATPIIMNWERVPSPFLEFKKNIEFSTSWDSPNIHRDRYEVELTYYNNVKPIDTVIVYSILPPQNHDVILSGWFNEIPIYYSRDDKGETIYFWMVKNINIIKFWTVIDNSEEFEKLKKKGLVQ